MLAPVLMALTQQREASWQAVVLLTVGAFAVRSCGCVINDICDREFDSKVARTAMRPLAAGTLSLRWAYFLVFLTGSISLLSISWIPSSSYLMILFCAALIIVYPLSKRFYPFPQLILGMAFASGIPCTYSFYQQPLDARAYQLVLTVIAWVVSFDTSYALADFEDDQKLPIQALTKTLGYTWSLRLSQVLLVICQLSISNLVFTADFYLVNIVFLMTSWVLSIFIISLADKGRHNLLVFQWHAILGFVWVLTLPSVNLNAAIEANFLL